MKTKEEIEQLAESKFNVAYQPYSKRGYIEGYTQCQEDMIDKKYTEEDMRAAMICVIVSDSIKNSKDITEYIASLNKQD